MIYSYIYLNFTCGWIAETAPIESLAITVIVKSSITDFIMILNMYIDPVFSKVYSAGRLPSIVTLNVSPGSVIFIINIDVSLIVTINCSAASMKGAELSMRVKKGEGTV